mmetsp:Transcript_106822/g.309002  ORF Transcript_106822/g.309002 Transcript_106822/m.309002 type:complete len:273 (-) Transcript_106822:95-913(-)
MPGAHLRGVLVRAAEVQPRDQRRRPPPGAPCDHIGLRGRQRTIVGPRRRRRRQSAGAALGSTRSPRWRRHRGQGCTLLHRPAVKVAEGVHLLVEATRLELGEARVKPTVPRVRLPEPTFLQQVVSGRQMVVLIPEQACHRIVTWKAVSVKLLENHIVEHAVVLEVFQRGLRHLLVPSVVTYPRQCEPLGRICGEHAADEVRNLVRDEVGHLVLGGADLAVELCVVRVLERQIAADKRKKDHTTTPDVNHWGMVLLASNHLGRGIARRATSRV